MFKKIIKTPPCIHCDSKNTLANGNKGNKQRYLCKNCNKSFSDIDNRIKRNNKERELALLLYIHNNSIRGIQSVIEKLYETTISTDTIDKWIKSFKRNLEKDLNIEKEKDKPKKINIIEINELLGYFNDLKQNSKKELKYGLLLVDDQIKLLDLK